MLDSWDLPLLVPVGSLSLTPLSGAFGGCAPLLRGWEEPVMSEWAQVSTARAHMPLAEE